MTPPRYRQVFDSVDEYADLTFDGLALLLRLIHIVDWRTAEVRCTRESLAADLRISQNRLVRLLDELEKAGIVARDFRRGHEGTVKVLAYPDVVKVDRVVEEAMRARLAQRPEQTDRPGQTRRNLPSGPSDQAGRATSGTDEASTPATSDVDVGNALTGWSDQGPPIYTSTTGDLPEKPVARAVSSDDGPACQSCGAVPSWRGWCAGCEPMTEEWEQDKRLAGMVA